MTARERQRRRHSRRKDPTRVILILGGALVGAIALILVIGVAYVAAIANKVPPLSDLKVTTYGIASTVYAADGSKLGMIKATILRQPVSSQQMPKYLRQATIAIEDHGFYQHGAVDYASLIRAALTDLTSGRTLQGGSTITMQLVRNIYPAVGDARTFSRKIKEAVVASRFEAKHSKLWILTDYLNTIPYGTVGGQTAEGVQAASWMFFDHPASQDTLAESALLAGLPQAPTDYNPFYHPRAALDARNQVLAAMEQYGYITPTAGGGGRAQAARRRPEHLLQGLPRELLHRLRHAAAARALRREGARGRRPQGLHDDQPAPGHARQAGDRRRARPPRRPLGRARLRESEQRLRRHDRPVGKLRPVAVQPGDAGPAPARLDVQGDRARRRALARHRPVHDDVLLAHAGSPAGCPRPPPTWSRSTAATASTPPLNLDQALVASDNTVFAQLAADLGEQSVTDMAYAMGVLPGTLHSYAAEALGGLTVGVTPLEMANVYATIADGGWRNKQITITKVVFPDGHVDRSWGIPHRTKVLSSAAAAVETEILQHNVEFGTATLSAIGCPTAAKTGTTSHLVDAWLDGFTPNRATVVWMGYPQANISMLDVHGQPQFGGLLPAQIWHNFMVGVATPPCAQLVDPASVPMTYVPFSGHYEQLGLTMKAPASTGPAGTASPAGPKHHNGGAKAQRGQTAPSGPGRPATGAPPKSTPPANQPPASTPPASTPPTTPATTTPATTPATTTPAVTTPATTPPPATGGATPNTGGAASPPAGAT